MALSVFETHAMHRGAWSACCRDMGGRTAVKAEATATLTRPRDAGMLRTSNVLTDPRGLQSETRPTVADCDTTPIPLSSGLDFVDLIDLDDYTVHSRLQDAVTYRMLVGSASKPCVDPHAGCFNLKQLKSYRDNVTRNLAPTVAYGFANAARAAGHAMSATQSSSSSAFSRSASGQTSTAAQPGSRPTPYQPKPVAPRQTSRAHQSPVASAQDNNSITDTQNLPSQQQQQHHGARDCGRDDIFNNGDAVPETGFSHKEVAVTNTASAAMGGVAAVDILALRSGGVSGTSSVVEYVPSAPSAQGRRRGNRGAGRGVAVAGAGRQASAAGASSASGSSLSSWIL